MLLYQGILPHPSKILHRNPHPPPHPAAGKILYHSRLADGLLVQWPDLLARYPRCRYAGRVM